MSVVCFKGAEIVRIPAKFTLRDTGDIPPVREHVRTLLRLLAGDSAQFLYLGFNEALNNAITHSSALEKSTVVKINVIAGKILIIRIKDQGAGFQGNRMIKNLRTEEATFEEMLARESGRGLMLIKAMFNKVFYNKDGTEIMLVKLLE